MRSAVLVVCLLAGGTATAWAQSGAVLSLDEAIAIALANNRTLQNAALAEEDAARDVAIARTKRLPVFSLEAQGSQLLRPVDISFPQGAFGNFPGIGPVPAVDTSVTTPARPTFLFNASVTQPITQLKKAGLNVRLSEATHEFEREVVRSTRLSVVNAVKRAYYTILQTRSALDAADANGRLLQEVDRVVGNRVVQKVALKGDSLDVQARLAEVELNVVTLTHSLASAKEQLNLLLGREVARDFDVAGVVEPTALELNPETARSRAVAARPEVRQAQLRVKQAELSERMARADYIPEIALAAQSLSPVNVDGAPRNISTVGVQLKWEPFDWGKKGHTVAAKTLELRQARNALRDAEDQVVLEINSQFRKVEEARAKLRVMRLSQETARENARVRVAQYQAQAALLSDVLQSETKLAESNDRFQQALLSLLTARADFELALGEEVGQ